MIVAVNTIRIKSGHIDEVAQRFMNPKGVTQAPGFLRMELWKEVLDEHDELKVCTTWEDRAAFDAWVGSDAFKQAHGRPAGAGAQAQHAGQQPQPGGHGAGSPESRSGGAGEAAAAAGGHPGGAGGPAGAGGHPGSGGAGGPGGVMLGAKLSVHEVLYTQDAEK